MASSALPSALTTPPEHPFLRAWWEPLVRQAGRDVDLCLRVAVMLADGIPRDTIVATLDLSVAELRSIEKRIGRIAATLEER